METYPIYIDRVQCGELKVFDEGLVRVFEAECRDNGKLNKLFIFGEQGSMLLGTLLPREGKLYLKRRLTRIELRSFPQNILYAADKKLVYEQEGWQRLPNGNLRKNINGVPYIAVQAQGFAGKKLTVINGKKYAVFPDLRANKK